MFAWNELRGFEMTEYPVRRNPKKILGVVAIIIILVVASYGILTFWKPRFVVYTYSSFMDWGDERAEAVLERAFAPFEEKYEIDIDFVILQTDANTMVSRLNAEAANPIADVVIGIDNILILQEATRNVLEPYESPMLSLINETYINALDPEHYLTPFDFGLVTLIYSMDTINTTTHPQLDNLTLADLATPELASSLVTEDPRFSSPGLAFLLSQIAISEEFTGENWTEWWETVQGNIDVKEGWTEAWIDWSSDQNKHLLVSYGTDPAYSAQELGTAPDTAIAPFHYEGSDWAWMQVEGVGLVKNAPHPDLAKAFIDYCLNATVQSEIPLNQWMFPVRTDLTLPSVYDYAIHPDEVSILNTLLDRVEIAENLQTWLDLYIDAMTPG